MTQSARTKPRLACLALVFHRFFHRLTVVSVSFCSLIKGINPKIRMLCFVLINSVLLRILCVQIRASFAQYGPCGLWKNATGVESG